MQITLTMKRRGGITRPLYVRAIDWRGPRPSILLHEHPTEADDSATCEALSTILEEVIAMDHSLTGYRLEARDFVHISEA